MLQKADQGSDYGIDYYATVFDAFGEPVRRFNVQVKYVDSTNVQSVTSILGCEHLVAESGIMCWNIMPAARHDLSMKHVDRYLNSSFTTDPTLYALANDRDLFYFWINDVFDYYLRWIGSSDQQTHSWWVSNIRPSRNAPNPTNGFLLVAPGIADGELGGICRQGSVGSLSNVAFSAYFRHVRTNGLTLAGFDCDGFWNYLKRDGEDRDTRIFLFGRFLGLLKPTSDMVDWSHATLSTFDSQFLVPSALRILASHDDRKSRELVLDWLGKQISGMTWWTVYDRLANREDWLRFSCEYMSALSDFLAVNVERGHEDAQEMLVALLFHFDYSVSFANLFALGLENLAGDGKLIPGPGLENLKGIVNSNTGTKALPLTTAIRSWDSAQRNDYRNSK